MQLNPYPPLQTNHWVHKNFYLSKSVSYDPLGSKCSLFLSAEWEGPCITFVVHRFHYAANFMTTRKQFKHSAAERFNFPMWLLPLTLPLNGTLRLLFTVCSFHICTNILIDQHSQKKACLHTHLRDLFFGDLLPQGHEINRKGPEKATKNILCSRIGNGKILLCFQYKKKDLPVVPSMLCQWSPQLIRGWMYSMPVVALSEGSVHI